MAVFRLKKILATLASIITFLFTSRLSFFTSNFLGLFTFSEPLFLLSALLLGPNEGAIVGGVGFALSNFLLGYPHYIMAAITVNSITGFLVGKTNQSKNLSHPLIGALSTSTLISSFTLVGTIIYSGEAYIGYTKDLFLGEEIMKFGGLYAYRLYFPPWLWIVAGALTVLISFLVSFKKSPKYLWASTALLVGCLTTILGYFLYETLLLPTLFKIKVDAITNLIVNLGHSVISANISILLYWTVKCCNRGKSV
jgi:uncharacterized membrane protein